MENQIGVLECRGRVQGDYPVYIPPHCTLAEKIIEVAHHRTLHGGVSYTMVEVRKRYWEPKLRQQVKSMIRNFYWCKRYGVSAFRSPPQGNLPKERTEGEIPFRIMLI